MGNLTMGNLTMDKVKEMIKQERLEELQKANAPKQETQKDTSFEETTAFKISKEDL